MLYFFFFLYFSRDDYLQYSQTFRLIFSNCSAIVVQNSTSVFCIYSLHRMPARVMCCSVSCFDLRPRHFVQIAPSPHPKISPWKCSIVFDLWSANYWSCKSFTVNLRLPSSSYLSQMPLKWSIDQKAFLHSTYSRPQTIFLFLPRLIIYLYTGRWKTEDCLFCLLGFPTV